MTLRRLLLILPVLLCGMAGVAGYAQSTNAGDIRGTVTDPDWRVDSRRDRNCTQH